MAEDRLFIVFLAVAAVVLLARALSERLRMPDAILLVLLGMAAGFVPALPGVVVPPELVLLGFLPPLLYHAAFFTAPREARADAVPIFTLAFGLTTVTTVAVAATVHALVPAADAAGEGGAPAGRRVRGELVRAQRRKLRALYRDGRIGAGTLREIGRELDFEDPTTQGSRP